MKVVDVDGLEYDTDQSYLVGVAECYSTGLLPPRLYKARRAERSYFLWGRDDLRADFISEEPKEHIGIHGSIVPLCEDDAAYWARLFLEEDIWLSFFPDSQLSSEDSSILVEKHHVSDMRPDGTCFQCRRNVGDFHLKECFHNSVEIDVATVLRHTVRVPAEFSVGEVRAYLKRLGTDPVSRIGELGCKMVNFHAEIQGGEEAVPYDLPDETFSIIEEGLLGDYIPMVSKGSDSDLRAGVYQCDKNKLVSAQIPLKYLPYLSVACSKAEDHISSYQGDAGLKQIRTNSKKDSVHPIKELSSFFSRIMEAAVKLEADSSNDEIIGEV